MIYASAARREDLPDLPRVVVPTRRPRDEAAWSKDWRSPIDVWRMGRALSRFDAVLFPTHYAFAPVSPRVSVALVVHDAIREAWPRLRVRSRMGEIRWGMTRWLAYRQADLIATPTEASAQAIREHLAVGDRPIVVLGAGIAPAFSPRESPADAGVADRWVPGGGRVVLYVGGLGPHKRVPDLIRAFGTVAADPACADVMLVLVGSEEGSPSELAAVERALEGLGRTKSRVVRLGFVPDATLAALYRRGTCLVLPSLAEGFGLPALEAMACGTPVVASRIPALEEVCADSAEYFDDIEGLPAVLARVLQDPGRRNDLARSGRIRAGAFGWDEAARRLLLAMCP